MEASAEDIVISGLSLRLPESDNVEEFWENLVNGVDMVTEDGRRWPPGFNGLPPRNGKLKDISRFDCAFFGVTPRQAEKMDPQLRLLLEVSYEALVESGHSWHSIKGSQTGVFIGSTFSDAHDLSTSGCDAITGYEMTGCNRAMLANRLSYVFDLKGPSMTIDTACSSGLECLCQAFSAIRQGRCDRALVGGVNLLLKPETSMQFMKLNMLSSDGLCKTFDDSADGYCRSEGVVALVIESRRSCRRNLLTIRSIVDNSDGYKPQGITFPSLDAQTALLHKAYKTAEIDPSDLAFLEAHGTGTQAGDTTELTAVDNVLCQNRSQSLLIGSVKSNIGHTEATSGLVSIAKVILAHQHKVLPGNLHFRNPNPKIPGLYNGHLKVVNKNTAWDGGIVGINSFGFGGANVHVVVETCTHKQNVTNSMETEQLPQTTILPTLSLVASRTKESVGQMLEEIQHSVKKYGKDIRGIINDLSQESLMTHPARGFTISGSDLPEVREHQNSETCPVWFVYPGMGCQWPGMGRELLQVPQCASVINKCHYALKDEGFDLLSLLETDDSDTYSDPLNSFVGICAIQMALTEVLKGVGLLPDGVLGHSVGELGCAFADETLTVEQTILAAYWRGKCVKAADLPEGAMAAVGLTWEKARAQCPEGVVPACHNSSKTVTISGPKQQVEQFVEKLQGTGVFARVVNSSGIAFHSHYMQRCSQPLLERLKKVIPHPKPRSEKWISTSVPEARATEIGSQLSSAEYHVNNLVSPVLFKEGLTRVPQNAIVIEIGPHCLLLSLIKRELGSSIIPLGTMKRESDNNTALLLSTIGRCYLEGHNIDLSYFYGTNEYPVSVGTPLMSSCISWQHSESWHVPSFKDITTTGMNMADTCTVSVDIASPEDMFLADHIMDGRILFPMAGYICMAWKACAKEHGLEFETMDVNMNNVKVHEAVILGKDVVTFSTQYSKCTGHLEISLNSLLICSATVKPLSKSINMKQENKPDDGHTETADLVLAKEDIYKFFRIKGYDYGDHFQCIKEYNLSSHSGHLEDSSNWVTHIDSLLHVCLLENHQDRDLMLPTVLKQVTICPKKDTTETTKALDICYKPCTKEVFSDTVDIKDVQFSTSTRRFSGVQPVQCKYSFEAYTGHTAMSPNQRRIHNLKNSVNNSVSKPGTPNKRQQNRELGTNSSQTIKPATGMYASYLKHLPPIACTGGVSPEPTNENTDDKALLKHCIDICAENIISGNIVIGCIVQTPAGVVYAKVVSSLMKAYAHVNIALWVSSREPSLLQRLDLPNAEVYSAMSDIPKTLFQATNILAFDTPQSNGLLHEVLPDNVIYLSPTKGVRVDIPTGYATILQKASTSSEVTVAQKQIPEGTNVQLVHVGHASFGWVEKLQKIMSNAKNSKSERIWLVYTGEEPSGVVGLVNCLLHEPGGKIIRCLMNGSLDDSPLPLPFVPGKQEFDNIAAKDLIMNIYRNGQWGSFRRKLLSEESLMGEVTDAFIDISVKGDLNSLGWFEANPKDLEVSSTCDIIQVTHAALNFRDVMCATGRLSSDALPGKGDGLLGLEFSGFDQNGVRRMGICNGKGFATKVRALKNHTWIAPSAWTLEEAASVPIAYVTAYYSLVVRAQVSTGQRVLIHSACSAVGQAAIHVAFAMGCVVYVTAGTPRKRDFLMRKYDIPAERVSNSRDLSFVDQFMYATNGEGIDVILNALAEEKLQASLDLLSQNGQFLEIGKFDLSQNTNLGMSVFLKNISFHGIQIETILEPENLDWIKVHRMVEDGISRQVVKPLDVTLYSRDSILTAFRYMSEGNHIGKIVIQIRTTDDILQLQTTRAVSLERIKAQRTLYFKSDVTYIIIGGLGGLALEMVNWMVRRGAKHFVLTSRSGIKTGYQKWMLDTWQKKSVDVLVSRCDVSDYGDTETLFNQAAIMAPVGGIFHLAAVLHDAMFEAQTPDTFRRVAEVKVNGIRHLDKVSRQRCGRSSSLDFFVAFSSAAASYGNAGQSNYGYANSYMERVCEKRVADGLAGKALQWGFIGDVGIVQEQLSGNDLYHMGMVPQRIPSFLSTLERFLLAEDGVVYSSIQPAPKETAATQKTMTKEDFSTQVTKSIFEILGVRDGSKISTSTPLIEMGLDSLMTTEIRQVLGRRFDLNLSVADVQNSTLDKIRSLKH